MIVQMLAYGQWANGLLLDGLARLDNGLLDAPQPVVFGSIRLTAQHLMVMGEVWRANMLGLRHGVTSRNPSQPLPLDEIAARLRAVDAWALDYAPRADLGESLRFDFIDGGSGAMARGMVLLHLVNHGTYHRGHIVAMLNGAGVCLPNSDLPVFLTAGN